MDIFPVVEDLLTFNVIFYDLDFVDENLFKKLPWWCVRKHENAVQPVRCKKHICYMSNINGVCQSFRCPNCDTYFEGASNLEQHLTICSERVKIVYPKNVYQIRGTLFDQRDSLGLRHTSEQKIFENLALFDFYSVCVQKETSKGTYTTTWTGKHVLISVSISSKTLWGNPFSTATVILINTLHLYWRSWKLSFPKQGKKKLLPW